MSVRHFFVIMMFCVFLALPASAREYHVSIQGDDSWSGAEDKPLRTISAAAQLLQPGDTVTVHEGVYRERINPPRGGTSDEKRIVYQAARGEKVVVKGSEKVGGWEKLRNDTWKVILPNSFFGGFNPYSDLISGDWFHPKGREHHTGAVYCNGHWLTEAVKLEEVLKPAGEAPSWLSHGSENYLLNVAWLQPAGTKAGALKKVQAETFAAKKGVQKAACSEGGSCIGWIEHGDWVRYEKVDFGSGADKVLIRAASVTEGGTIELRLNAPEGKLLGACAVAHTGGWQAWKTITAKINPVSGVKTLCLVFKGKKQETEQTGLWYAKVDAGKTTIWAQFAGVDPNETDVEINVRRAVFYPEKPGVNFITVRGFTLMQAATPWAPPTAEQIGLIGTHWSRGWIIENNDISYSTCVGITLGKYGDAWDNRSQSADAYNRTIRRALQNGWNKETIGHHMVRNNHISHCEQAGIVGSLGPVFSTITGNVIHDIHVRRLFTGAEMAGIKLHAAIDTVIRGNHIYRTTRGIWLDWMAQGTHVTQNLLHDNGPSEDLFVEVNHGPFMVDNNVFLSPTSLLDVSEGGAYVHNLFAGRLILHPELNRETPYHPAHSTKVAGLRNIKGGDNRFYNNIFAGGTGLVPYDKAVQHVYMAGNVFLNGAKPAEAENQPVFMNEFDPNLVLVEADGSFFLQMQFDRSFFKGKSPFVSTAMLGKALVSALPYEKRDGSPLALSKDYFGKERDKADPAPGPFARPGIGMIKRKVW